MTTVEAACPGAGELDRIVRAILPGAGQASIAGPIGGGFSGALVYRIDVGPQRFALRGWPHAAITPPRLRELHRYIAYLHREGFPVPVPLRRWDGSTYLLAEARTWQIEPWLAGAPDREKCISSARLKEAMLLLARLHLCSSRYEPAPDGRAWFSSRIGPSPSIAERRALVAGWDSGRLRRALSIVDKAPAEFQPLLANVIAEFVASSGHVHSELEDLEEQAVPLHPCLRDLWRDHLLFTGEQVTGLIDLSAARTEHPAADLARLLGSLLSDDRQPWAEALSVYEQLRPFTPIEHRLLGVLDRSGALLSGMAWVDRWMNGRIPQQQWPQVAKRLEHIVMRLQAISRQSVTRR